MEWPSLVWTCALASFVVTSSVMNEHVIIHDTRSSGGGRSVTYLVVRHARACSAVRSPPISCHHSLVRLPCTVDIWKHVVIDFGSARSSHIACAPVNLAHQRDVAKAGLVWRGDGGEHTHLDLRVAAPRAAMLAGVLLLIPGILFFLRVIAQKHVYLVLVPVAARGPISSSSSSVPSQTQCCQSAKILYSVYL